MKIINFIIFILILFAPITLKAEDSFDQKLDVAKNAYFDKKYKDAEKQFQDLLNDQPDNGYLHYNLGNTYFKMGNLGQAILQYEKAKLFIPRNHDLKFNLNLAHSKLSDEVSESFKDYLVNTFYFWSPSITLSEYRLILIIFSCLFWGFCFYIYLAKKRLVSLKTMLSFIFLAYLGFGYHLMSDLYVSNRFAIILKPEVDIKASYLDKDKPLFQLHEGTKVRILDKQVFGEDNQWYRISMPEGQKGWVKFEDVGVI